MTSLVWYIISALVVWLKCKTIARESTFSKRIEVTPHRYDTVINRINAKILKLALEKKSIDANDKWIKKLRYHYKNKLPGESINPLLDKIVKDHFALLNNSTKLSKISNYRLPGGDDDNEQINDAYDQEVSKEDEHDDLHLYQDTEDPINAVNTSPEENLNNTSQMKKLGQMKDFIHYVIASINDDQKGLYPHDEQKGLYPHERNDTKTIDMYNNNLDDILNRPDDSASNALQLFNGAHQDSDELKQEQSPSESETIDIKNVNPSDQLVNKKIQDFIKPEIDVKKLNKTNYVNHQLPNSPEINILNKPEKQVNHQLPNSETMKISIQSLTKSIEQKLKNAGLIGIQSNDQSEISIIKNVNTTETNIDNESSNITLENTDIKTINKPTIESTNTKTVKNPTIRITNIKTVKRPTTQDEVDHQLPHSKSRFNGKTDHKLPNSKTGNADIEIVNRTDNQVNYRLANPESVNNKEHFSNSTSQLDYVVHKLENWTTIQHRVNDTLTSSANSTKVVEHTNGTNAKNETRISGKNRKPIENISNRNKSMKVEDTANRTSNHSKSNVVYGKNYTEKNANISTNSTTDDDLELKELYEFLKNMSNHTKKRKELDNTMISNFFEEEQHRTINDVASISKEIQKEISSKNRKLGWSDRIRNDLMKFLRVTKDDTSS